LLPALSANGSNAPQRCSGGRGFHHRGGPLLKQVTLELLHACESGLQ